MHHSSQQKTNLRPRMLSEALCSYQRTFGPDIPYRDASPQSSTLFLRALHSSAQTNKEKCKQSDTELCLRKSRGLGRSPGSNVVSVSCPVRTVRNLTSYSPVSTF